MTAGAPPQAITGAGGNGTEEPRNIAAGQVPVATTGGGLTIAGPAIPGDVLAATGAGTAGWTLGPTVTWTPLESFRASWEAAELTVLAAEKCQPLRVAHDTNFIYLEGGLKGAELTEEHLKVALLPEGFRPAKITPIWAEESNTTELVRYKFLIKPNGELVSSALLGTVGSSNLFFQNRIRF